MRKSVCHMASAHSSSLVEGEPEWVRAVHRFWFGEEDVRKDNYTHLFQRWYRGGPEFDDSCRREFQPLLSTLQNEHETEPDLLAARCSTLRGPLALVLVLDQMSRNMFRGTTGMFATDCLARPIARKGWERVHELAPVEALFLAVALEHSEDVEDVRTSANWMHYLVSGCPGPQRKRFEAMVKYNKQHLDIVERFGRYPHRNELLGRETTGDERVFLSETSYGFMKSVKAPTRRRAGRQHKDDEETGE